MKKRFFIYVTAAILLVCGAVTANAWGPRVELAVVNTALHLISREENLPLTKLQEELRAGASLSPVAMEAMFPDMASDPLRAIENEMALLTAARGARIDAYFAWRLGALGKLVSRVTAPMATADPAVRSQYYKDAEPMADTGSLKPETRHVLESMERLKRTMDEANAGNDLITGEYQSGAGFRGTASARLAGDISRSVNAVADVWWTIIASSTVPGNISAAQMQRYVLSAYAYYVERGRESEIEAADANYRKLTEYTPDMSAKIGDMLYAAGMRERAVKEYEAAVAAAPERRDVVEKIANYYAEVAEENLEKGLLEESMAGFEKALSVNMLHPTAEKRRLEVAALIQKRDDQLAQYQAQLKQAEDLRALAEEEAAKNRFAEAVALLKQSEEAYKTVGDEFPSEAQRRTRGLRDVQARTNELQQGLLTNTQAFSGAGFAPDLRALIAQDTAGLDQEILKTMVRLEYEAEVERLTAQMQSTLSIE